MKFFRIEAFLFLTYLYTSHCEFQRFVPRCPSYGIERILKARGVCSSVEKYHCLYDDIWNLAEVCLDYKQMGPGTYPRYNSFGAGNIDSDQCNSSFYQSRVTKSYQISNCLSVKSKCSSEGQVLCNKGTIQTDVTCRCDHTQGYASMTQGCCSPTGMNDCSCYKKLCPAGQELDKDYNCVNKCPDGSERKIGENWCTPITNVTTRPDPSENKEAFIKHDNMLDKENIHKQIIFDLSVPKALMIVDAGFYLVVTVVVLVLGSKWSKWRTWIPIRYKLAPFIGLNLPTLSVLVISAVLLYTEKNTQSFVRIASIIFAVLMLLVLVLFCYVGSMHDISEECTVVNENYDKRVYQYLQAAADGNLTEVIRLKNEDYIDMEEVDYDKRSALHLAACNVRPKVVEYLIEKDLCFPNAKDRWKRTALEDLHWHVKNKYQKEINLDEDFKKNIDLIEKKIKDYQQKRVSKRHFRGEKAARLIHEAENGDLSSIKRLHMMKADMNLPNSSGRTALHAAAAAGHEDIVDYLIEKCRVSPFVRWHGKRPVEVSADHQNIRTKLEKYMDSLITVKNNDKNEPEVIKFDYKDTTGCLVRMFNSVASGDIQQLRLLRKSNPKILYSCDYDMRTALHVAVSENQEHIIKFLLEDPKQQKKAVESMDRWNYTPFEASIHAKENNIEEAYHEIVHKCPGVVDTENDDYKTCILLNAAKMKAGDTYEDGKTTGLDVIKSIHKRRVDLNLRDYDGRTALHVAAAENNVEVVDYLVNEAKVVVDIPDRDGHLPENETENKQIIDLIKSNSGKTVKESKDLSATEANIAVIMKWALRGKLKSQMEETRYKHFRMDCIDHMKNTPLHVSTDKCQLADVKFLIEDCKVSPFPRNSLGQTPLKLVGKKIKFWRKKEKESRDDNEKEEAIKRKEKFQKIEEVLDDAMKDAIETENIDKDETFEKHSGQEKIFLFLSKAYKGDIMAIKRYIKTDPSIIDKVDYDNRSALHIAAAEGHHHIVKYLDKEGADKNLKDRWNKTPRI